MYATDFRHCLIPKEFVIFNMMSSDLERKVAQLLIVGVSGAQLSAEEKKISP